MKIKPETLLLGNNDILYNKILGTCSDESFINHVVEFVINKFKKLNYFIDSKNTIDSGLVGNLFSDKKTLFFLKDVAIKKESLDLFRKGDQAVVLSYSTNKKAGALRASFAKLEKHLLIECYPLSRSSKEFVIKNYIKSENINLSTDVYWYLLESLENSYVLLINQLKLLSLLES